MAGRYPLLFDPANAENLRIIETPDGAVASHAGFVLREARLGGRQARLACIGAVFTLPERRGRGLATAVVEDALSRARALGAAAVLVSGAGPLYERLGFARLGPAVRYLSGGDVPGAAELTVTAAATPDVPELAALYDREPVRFVRPEADWTRLLGARTVFYGQGNVYLVCRGSRVVGYLAVDETPREGRALALEIAGERAAVLGAAGALRGLVGAPVDIVAPAHDAELAATAAARGIPCEALAFPFSAAVWDPALASTPLPWYGLNYV